MTKRDLREIAEIIWLQNYLQTFESNVERSVQEVKEDDAKQSVVEEKPNIELPPRVDSPPESIVETRQSESIVQPINIRVESKGSGASTGQQLAVFTETAPTLDSLEYAKRLKTLVHLRSTRSSRQLDIARTIHATARNGGRLSIETKRAVANYSRLVVIEEVSETMKVWEGMGQQLLDVALGYTQFSHSTLHKISFETSAEPFEIPSGSDTVVILISDGLSSEFLGGGVHSALSSMPDSCHIGWLHPWDYEEWYKTNVSDLTTSKPETVQTGKPLDLFLIGSSFENWNGLTRWIQRDQVSDVAGKRVYPSLSLPTWFDAEESEESSEETTDTIREKAERLLDTLETFAARQVTDLLAIVACLPWGGVDLDILLRLGQRFVYGTFNRTHIAQLIASGVLYKDGKRSTDETTVFYFPNQETRLVFRRNMPKSKIVPVINFLLDQVSAGQSRRLGFPTDLLLSFRAGELNLEMMTESPNDSQLEALKELADFARWPNMYQLIEQLENLKAPAERYIISWKERYSTVLQTAFTEAWWKDIDEAGYDHYHGIDFANVTRTPMDLFHGGFSPSGKDEEKLLTLLLKSDFNHKTAQVLHSLVPLMGQRKVEMLQYQFEHCGPLEAGSEGMCLWQLLTCAFENACQSYETNFDYIQIPSELLKLTDLLSHFNPNRDLVESEVYDQWREDAEKVEAWHKGGLQLNLWETDFWSLKELGNFIGFINAHLQGADYTVWQHIAGDLLSGFSSFNIRTTHYKEKFLQGVKQIGGQYPFNKVSIELPILPYPSILLPIEKWNQYVSVLVKGLLLGRNMYVHPDLANHWYQFMSEGHWKVKDFWSRSNWGSQDWSMLIGEQHHEPEPWFLHVAGQPGSGRETTLLHAVSQSTDVRDADHWPKRLVAVGHQSIDWSSITINEAFVNKIDSRSADVWIQILCQMTRDEDVLESAVNLIGNDNTFTLENLPIPTGIKCVSILETELDKSFYLESDSPIPPDEYIGLASLSPKGYQLAQPVLIEEVSQTLQMGLRPYREVERELFEMNAAWSAPEMVQWIDSHMLPLLLLIDTSGSMYKEISTINEAVQLMIESLQKDSHTKRIHLAIIVFGSGQGNVVELHMPLTPIHEVEFTPMSVGGATPMGAALDLARTILEDVTLIPENSSKPIVILFTDGEPTDNYTQSLKQFLDSDRGSQAQRISIAFGQGANLALVSQFASNGEGIYLDKGALSENIARLFSQAVDTVSDEISEPVSAEQFEFPFDFQSWEDASEMEDLKSTLHSLQEVWSRFDCHFQQMVNVSEMISDEQIKDRFFKACIHYRTNAEQVAPQHFVGSLFDGFAHYSDKFHSSPQDVQKALTSLFEKSMGSLKDAISGLESKEFHISVMGAEKSLALTAINALLGEEVFPMNAHFDHSRLEFHQAEVGEERFEIEYCQETDVVNLRKRKEAMGTLGLRDIAEASQPGSGVDLDLYYTHLNKVGHPNAIFTYRSIEDFHSKLKSNEKGRGIEIKTIKIYTHRITSNGKVILHDMSSSKDLTSEKSGSFSAPISADLILYIDTIPFYKDGAYDIGWLSGTNNLRERTICLLSRTDTDLDFETASLIQQASRRWGIPKDYVVVIHPRSYLSKNTSMKSNADDVASMQEIYDGIDDLRGAINKWSLDFGSFTLSRLHQVLDEARAFRDWINVSTSIDFVSATPSGVESVLLNKELMNQGLLIDPKPEIKLAMMKKCSTEKGLRSNLFQLEYFFVQSMLGTNGVVAYANYNRSDRLVCIVYHFDGDHAGKAFFVRAGIGLNYVEEHEGVYGQLGFPISDETSLEGRSAKSEFENGTITYSFQLLQSHYDVVYHSDIGSEQT